MRHDQDDRPPAWIGTWTRAYRIILGWLIVAILGIVLFSRWGY